MRTVLTHGVFDVLHAGHLAYLTAAKAHGDYLIVSVTSDRFVNKGPGRPYFTDKIRAQMVGALSIVDKVVISDYPTAVKVINELKPSFYVKGPDYRDLKKDPTGGIYAEKLAVESNGGEIVFTEEETHSSSALLNRFFIERTDAQLLAINNIKSLGGLDLVLEMLDKVSALRVLVIGEPIIDTYRFCTPENISSKSPSISARFNYEENYAGGALAIANHLADFVRRVHLFTYDDVNFEQIDQRINVRKFHVPHGTPRKIRYIEATKQQRIFEVTHIDESWWDKKDLCSDLLRYSWDTDLNVIADFGHGLFENGLLDTLAQVKTTKALNVQTNSSNFGFNVFKKHKSFDYLSLDLREARVAYHDRDASAELLHQKARLDTGRAVAMTLGAQGAYFENSYSPAFSDTVVDATGAGDAFFALTSCLYKAGCPEELIPFLGNVFAGLKTKIVGNKSAVTKAQLIKAVEAILK